MKQEFIKSHRLRWAANVKRIENIRTTRKITEWTPYKTRPVGRPRLRWMDQVEEDIDRSGMELFNRSRRIHGCGVNRTSTTKKNKWPQSIK